MTDSGDIRLRTLSPDHHDRRTRTNMNRKAPSSRKASSNIFGSGKRAQKRGTRYTDLSEEEADLLGPDQRDDFNGADDATMEDGDSSVVQQVNEPEPSRLQRKASSSSSLSSKDKSRTIPFRPPEKQQNKFPANVVRNQKYNVATFLPLVFYEQFKFFFNLYFLLVALSQFIPALKIGFIVTYVAPLAFVLTVTMGKEAYDDYKRNLRDREANSQKYLILEPNGITDPSSTITPTRAIPSSKLRVGDLVLLEKNQRVPADVVLLRTSDASGTCFIRTDQLDGETDWKLRVAVPSCQKLQSDQELLNLDAEIYADGPIKDIHTFVGTFSIHGNSKNQLAPDPSSSGADVPLVPKVEPLTAENVLWSNTVLAAGLRVNLDMGKTVYAQQIMTDNEIPNTIVRTSTLPEELGRIEYLLSDKTGTLTQNEMEMKKLHMGTISYGFDSMDEVAHQLAIAFGGSPESNVHRQMTMPTGAQLASRGRRDMSSRLREVVMSLALCHNVTPVTNDDGSVTYQASSPDEVAIVKWTESVGLTLTFRDRTRIDLQAPDGHTLSFDVLDIFPFTSESKRMGIVVRDTTTHEISFLQKGADVVMAKIVQRNDWLEEETGNMAREGLRTLVMAKKKLSSEAYNLFKDKYHEASISLEGRNEAMAKVVADYLERDLELLGLTGVEDKLQDDVKQTLELLRNAGIKIWMLTGDKIETATCIAISTKLVARNQYIHQVAKLKTADAARDQLEFLQSKLDCCLVIDGESLQLCLNMFKTEFIEIATKLSAVVACRCSPTQKADVARLIRQYTKKRVCCIGDGGNDVSMIQAADVGVGIVGKEGKQASLAADFSVTQFSYLTKLLVWHGRNSYKRSAKLAQFVIHRGLIISIMQAVFSAIFYFAPIALYQGWLMVGYATIYTMAPVFSLVLDRDVNEDVALLYPELYKELTKGRSLSFKTFFQWLMISLYQGGAIMIMSLVLFENEFLNIVSISFTALILNELIMVALEITTWHVYMVASEIVTLFFYVISIAFLPEYFDLSFVVTTRFAWKVAVIVAISSFPLYLIKAIKSRVKPATYTKLL
ncbi:putative aminophospholipid-translocase [Tulasnella sp. 419]|nr:putative aminophospholipid-translocase [Tulasnella sp. 418]KAG8953391.1 putative aminophospholipid-translocase [Tulasnella sp. 419]